jgi:hypothetical protein
MLITKRNIIQSALSEMGINPESFPVPVSRYVELCRRLDGIAANAQALGIPFGYPIASDSSIADLDSSFNLPNAVVPYLYYQLAVNGSSMFGKAVTRETKQAASNSLTTLYEWSYQPTSLPYPKGVYAGSGNKPWRYVNETIIPQSEALTISPDVDTEIHLNGTNI